MHLLPHLRHQSQNRPFYHILRYWVVNGCSAQDFDGVQADEIGEYAVDGAPECGSELHLVWLVSVEPVAGDDKSAERPAGWV